MRDLAAPEGASACPGFRLRRLHAGELPDSEAAEVRAHAESCERCTRTLQLLDQEQSLLTQRLSLASFRAGVDARGANLRAEPRGGGLRRWIPIALAACLATVVAVPLLRSAPSAMEGERTKGGPALDVIVGGDGATREAEDGERLAPGEAVRLRVHPGGRHWALALSVDDAGQVSVLYDDGGASLPIETAEPTLLPDSIAFDGKGAERLYLFASSQPLSTEPIRRALEAAWARAGSAEKMGPVDGVPADQLTRLLVKP